MSDRILAGWTTCSEQLQGYVLGALGAGWLCSFHTLHCILGCRGSPILPLHSPCFGVLFTFIKPAGACLPAGHLSGRWDKRTTSCLYAPGTSNWQEAFKNLILHHMTYQEKRPHLVVGSMCHPLDGTAEGTLEKLSESMKVSLALYGRNNFSCGIETATGWCELPIHNTIITSWQLQSPPMLKRGLFKFDALNVTQQSSDTRTQQTWRVRWGSHGVLKLKLQVRPL
jgi:hypothetical protein